MEYNPLPTKQAEGLINKAQYLAHENSKSLE